MTVPLMITPKTKVGELLEAYPALEKVLIEVSPVFAKLKNPILRKTVAKVATLQQAAIIGNMPVEELVNNLRIAAGHEEIFSQIQDSGFIPAEPPEWFNPAKIASRFDASVMINAGESPMNEVMHRSGALREDEILELSTSFIPAPVIELLRKKNFSVWVNQTDKGVLTYISRKLTPQSGA